MKDNENQKRKIIPLLKRKHNRSTNLGSFWVLMIDRYDQIRIFATKRHVFVKGGGAIMSF